MSWVKLDDSMTEHPKVLASGALGWALDVAGILYSARARTDGWVPAGKVATLLDLSGMPVSAQDLAEKLVAVGRWHPDPRGGYLIHDFLDYQPSKADAEAMSASRRAGGKAGAERRWSKAAIGQPMGGPMATPMGAPMGPPMGTHMGDPMGPHMANAWQNHAPVPDPIKTPSESPPCSPPTGRTRATTSVLPNDWRPTSDHTSLAARLGLDCADQAERMRDYARANPKWRKADWDATFRNWLKSARPSRPVQQVVQRDQGVPTWLPTE